MLENLLNNKLKRGLLGILFACPTRSFSIPELKNITRGNIKHINQALREFVRADIVEAASQKQKRYFRINPYFRLYEELEGLISDQEIEFEDEVCRKLKQIPDVKLVMLSGIFTLQPQLPVDLLVIGEEVNRAKLQRILADIEKLVGQEINYTIMSRLEYEYRQMMNDRFVRDIIDYPHLVVFNNLKNK